MSIQEPIHLFTSACVSYNRSSSQTMLLTNAKLSEEDRSATNAFKATDVALILREHGWLREETPAVSAWMDTAGALLGSRAADRDEFVRLIELVFRYDARAVLESRATQEMLSREGARDVLRALAAEILSGGPVDSNRLKEIVAALKAKVPYRSRDIFLPLRVAVAGRAGGGELDRVILLLDSAAAAAGLAPVKSVRARMLEFCAAMD